MTRKIQKAGSCFIHSKDKNACLSVKRKNSKRKKTKNRNSNNEMNLCEFYQSAVKIPYLGALRTNVSKTDGECHLSYDFILSIANNYNYTFNTSYTLGGKTFGSKVFKLVGESKEKNPYVPTRLILGSLLDKKDNKFFRNFPLNSQQDKEQKIKLVSLLYDLDHLFNYTGYSIIDELNNVQDYPEKLITVPQFESLCTANPDLIQKCFSEVSQLMDFSTQDSGYISNNSKSNNNSNNDSLLRDINLIYKKSNENQLKKILYNNNSQVEEEEELEEIQNLNELFSMLAQQASSQYPSSFVDRILSDDNLKKRLIKNYFTKKFNSIKNILTTELCFHIVLFCIVFVYDKLYTDRFHHSGGSVDIRALCEEIKKGQKRNKINGLNHNLFIKKFIKELNDKMEKIPKGFNSGLSKQNKVKAYGALSMAFIVSGIVASGMSFFGMFPDLPEKKPTKINVEDLPQFEHLIPYKEGHTVKGTDNDGCLDPKINAICRKNYEPPETMNPEGMKFIKHSIRNNFGRPGGFTKKGHLDIGNMKRMDLPQVENIEQIKNMGYKTRVVNLSSEYIKNDLLAIQGETQAHKVYGMVEGDKVKGWGPMSQKMFNKPSAVVALCNDGRLAIVDGHHRAQAVTAMKDITGMNFHMIEGPAGTAEKFIMQSYSTPGTIFKDTSGNIISYVDQKGHKIISQREISTHSYFTEDGVHHQFQSPDPRGVEKAKTQSEGLRRLKNMNKISAARRGNAVGTPFDQIILLKFPLFSIAKSAIASFKKKSSNNNNNNNNNNNTMSRKNNNSMSRTFRRRQLTKKEKKAERRERAERISKIKRQMNKKNTRRVRFNNRTNTRIISRKNNNM